MAQLGEWAELFPVPSDAVQLAQGRVAGEHGLGVGKYQCINFTIRRCSLEAGEYGRTEQDITVVAELDDQRATDLCGLDGISQIAGGGLGLHLRIVAEAARMKRMLHSIGTPRAFAATLALLREAP